MGRLIKNRQIIDDPWQLIADDAELPAGPMIIPLARGPGRAVGGAGAEYRCGRRSGRGFVALAGGSVGVSQVRRWPGLFPGPVVEGTLRLSR